MRTADIQPCPTNPRRIGADVVDAVAESIRRFGFVQPVVLRRGEVVIGHARLLAAKKLGIAELPAVNADGLTPGQARALRIADNKVGELAAWDTAALAGELADLADLADACKDADGDIDWSALGFSAAEIESLGKDVSADIDIPLSGPDPWGPQREFEEDTGAGVGGEVYKGEPDDPYLHRCTLHALDDEALDKVKRVLKDAGASYACGAGVHVFRFPAR